MKKGTMGSRRYYNEWVDDFRTPSGRAWVKRYTNRLDRVDGKRDIQEQLTEDCFRFDPD
jgi:hypothetical protein